MLRPKARYAAHATIEGGTQMRAGIRVGSHHADVEQGLAAGLTNSSRQIGSALGVAILMAVALSVAPHHTVPSAAALAAGYRMALAVAGGLGATAFVVSATCPTPPRQTRPDHLRNPSVP